MEKRLLLKSKAERLNHERQLELRKIIGRMRTDEYGIDLVKEIYECSGDIYLKISDEKVFLQKKLG